MSVAAFKLVENVVDHGLVEGEHRAQQSTIDVAADGGRGL